MAPDVEELISRVNTLTLDKNRLKQRLMQLTNVNSKPNQSVTTNQSPSQLLSSFSAESSIDQASKHNSSTSKNSIMTQRSLSGDESANVIAGIECTTSCENDLLYMNELYKKYLDEYSSNWDLLQSNCSALLSELNAIQKHYAMLKREKSELEAALKAKCDDYDKIKSEFQLVVLNYETQLGAMSEHLSTITSQLTNEDTIQNSKLQ